MKWNKIVGKSLIVSGSVLSILGIIIIFAKGNSTVTFMSLPVLFLGILIWYNTNRNSLAKNNDSESVIPKG
jgi:hypothetical protein